MDALIAATAAIRLEAINAAGPWVGDGTAVAGHGARELATAGG